MREGASGRFGSKRWKIGAVLVAAAGAGIFAWIVAPPTITQPDTPLPQPAA